MFCCAYISVQRRSRGGWYALCLGVCVMGGELRLAGYGQRKVIVLGGLVYAFLKGVDSNFEFNLKLCLIPAHLARGLAQAPVSSKNRSSGWTCLGWVKICCFTAVKQSVPHMVMTLFTFRVGTANGCTSSSGAASATWWWWWWWWQAQRQQLHQQQQAQQ